VRTGQGQRLELNLLSSTLSGMVNFTGAYAMAGHVAHAIGIRHPSICPYEAYPTADRPLVIAAGNDRQFAALCQVVGLPELAADARFAGNDDRVANRDGLAEVLAGPLAQRPAAQWAEALSAAGVPCGPVNDVAGGVALARKLGLDPVVEAGGVAQVASPFALSATPVSHRLPPPRLGADAGAVRQWLADEGSEENPVG
jgi:crotonobetainyl-CoA:carnitine CoA-transferase CaiB-like acyl-CoA transferase